MKMLCVNMTLFWVLTCCQLLVAMSYNGTNGHKAQYQRLFGDLGGDNLSQLHKSISQGMDVDFPAYLKQRTGLKLHANHRYLGHWGFEGSIPFNDKVYGDILSQYPRDEIISAWRDFVNSQTQKAMSLTGLPEKQARALAGLIYDDHILADLLPGNKVLEPLSSVQSIKKDIVKNMHRLFGNNSEYVRDVERRLSAILKETMSSKQGANPQLAAERILKELNNCGLGDKLYTSYGHKLQRMKIVPKQTQAWSNALATRMGRPQHLSLEQSVKYKAKIRKEGLPKPKIPASRVQECSGLLSQDGKLLIFNSPLKAAKEGILTGAAIIITESSIAAYQHIRGETREWEMYQAIREAAMKGVFVGTAVAVTVLLGATPHGWCVLAVSIGAYIVIDTAIKVWNHYQDRKYLTMDDLRGFGIYSDTPIDVTVEGILKPSSESIITNMNDTPLSL